MPGYYSRGVKVHLATTSLAASTTQATDIFKAGSRPQKNDIARTDSVLASAKPLFERSVQDEHGDFMRFLGGGSTPFYCVSISSRQEERASATAPSSGTALVAAPIPQAIATEQSTNEDAGIIKADDERLKDDSDLIQHSDESECDDEAGKAVNSDAPSVTTAKMGHSQVTTTCSAADRVEDSPSQALVLSVELSEKTFGPEGRSKYSNDIKIEVFYNGKFSDCAFLTGKAFQSKQIMSRQGLENFFAGHRVHRLLERPWLLTAGKSSHSQDSRPTLDEVQNQAQARWEHINNGILREVALRGTTRDNIRSPVAEFLNGLAAIECPKAGLHNAASSMGVIDVVVTLGSGKKYGPSSTYISQPTRMVDSRYKTDWSSEPVVDLTAPADEQPSLSTGSPAVHEAFLDERASGDHILMPIPRCSARRASSRVVSARGEAAHDDFDEIEEEAEPVPRQLEEISQVELALRAGAPPSGRLMKLLMARTNDQHGRIMQSSAWNDYVPPKKLFEPPKQPKPMGRPKRQYNKRKVVVQPVVKVPDNKEALAGSASSSHEGGFKVPAKESKVLRRSGRASMKKDDEDELAEDNAPLPKFRIRASRKGEESGNENAPPPKPSSQNEPGRVKRKYVRRNTAGRKPHLSEEKVIEDDDDVFETRPIHQFGTGSLDRNPFVINFPPGWYASTGPTNSTLGTDISTFPRQKTVQRSLSQDPVVSVGLWNKDNLRRIVCVICPEREAADDAGETVPSIVTIYHDDKEYDLENEGDEDELAEHSVIDVSSLPKEPLGFGSSAQTILNSGLLKRSATVAALDDDDPEDSPLSSHPESRPPERRKQHAPTFQRPRMGRFTPASTDIADEDEFEDEQAEDERKAAALPTPVRRTKAISASSLRKNPRRYGLPLKRGPTLKKRRSSRTGRIANDPPETQSSLVIEPPESPSARKCVAAVDMPGVVPPVSPTPASTTLLKRRMSVRFADDVGRPLEDVAPAPIAAKEAEKPNLSMMDPDIASKVDVKPRQKGRKTTLDDRHVASRIMPSVPDSATPLALTEGSGRSRAKASNLSAVSTSAAVATPNPVSNPTPANRNFPDSAPQDPNEDLEDPEEDQEDQEEEEEEEEEEPEPKPSSSTATLAISASLAWPIPEPSANSICTYAPLLRQVRRERPGEFREERVVFGCRFVVW